MWKLWLVLCGIVPSAIAQTNTNSITYTATRTVIAVPDQVRFIVGVNTPGDATLDQVVAILAPAGIGAAQLIYINQNSQIYDPTVNVRELSLQWSFDLTVPLAMVKATVAALSALPQKGATTVSFHASGARSATEMDDFLQCPPADLLVEARAQAVPMAALAGGTVGQILALSDGSLGDGSGNLSFSASFLSTVPIPTAAFRSNQVAIPGNIIPFVAYPLYTTCTLTVKFQLLRYQ